MKAKLPPTTQQDLIVLIMSAIIGGALIFLYPNNFYQVLDREAVFVKPQGQVTAQPIDQDRVPRLEELLAQQPQKPPEKPNFVPAGASYLLIGDSMMQDGIGSELEQRLKDNKVGRVFRKAIQSTGLLNPDRLDWYAEADRLLASRRYDVVVIMLGLNDADHMRDANGVYQTFGTARWKVAYARKVEQMLNQLLVKNRVKRVVWVGLPVAPDRFWDNNVRVLNEVYKTVVNRHLNAVYVDSYDRFKVNGRWASVVADNRGVARTARQSDGLHMTIHGGKIMADLIVNVMKKNDFMLGNPPKPTPTPAPLAPLAPQIKESKIID